jgi:aerobic carbon-monoxide dehydrogenase small subunit
MSFKQEISFTLNGVATAVSIPVDMTTLTMLRDVLKLMGTKLGCGEGECGSCTILVDKVAINSCIMFAVDCDGRDITTIEGIQTAEGLDLLQQELVAHGAVQCGFCTPGMVMQGTAMLRENPKMTEDEIKSGLEGNLCRCTGYTKVIDAFASALEKTGGEGQS